MKIRNIAIIAHVDHGKTTLVNKLIETSLNDEHTKIEDRAMDSSDIEKERGITILAKNTSIKYNDYTINILDTPGHADFGGEVERILHMVDGVLLLVDAFEGVMPQTRFVLKKALENNIKPIVVINKIDRPLIDIQKTLNEVYDLFIDLGASESDLEFPILYGSSLLGKMSKKPSLEHNEQMRPLLDSIIENIPEPLILDRNYLLFQPSLIEYNNFVGRMGVGKIYSGEISVGSQVSIIRNNNKIETFRVQKIYESIGLEKREIKKAFAGDIVSIAGLSDIQVGETITDLGYKESLPKIDIGEPTVEIEFSSSTSPFVGKEGEHVTSSKIEQRLYKEAQKDVSLKVKKGSEKETWIVSGRGELHLSILIESMRREGFEFQVSKPKIVIKEEDNIKYEPYEMVYIDCPNELVGSVIDSLNTRGGELVEMNQKNNFTNLNYIVPSRGLIGYMTNFLTITKGYGVINHSFYEYRKYEKREINKRRAGALISINQGYATQYAIERLEDRGIMFIEPRTLVYEGMIVGENNREDDLVVNVTQERQLTNIRQSNKDQTVVLKKSKKMGLEESLAFINDDELLEITPSSIRIRKKYLKASDRKRIKKNMV